MTLWIRHLKLSRCAVLMLAVLVTATLTGCPDDPFNPKTWTKKLGDPKEVERAVTELERLGEPSAIPALGKAWEKQGRPERILQVIIDLSKPLTEAEAKAQYKYNSKARPASWDKSLPILVKAIDDVDAANPRSVESARLAAEALGEAKLDEALDSLIKAATSSEAKAVRGQAILSLGVLGKDGAVPTLANILREEFDPQNPAMHGAAIIALGKIKSPLAVPVLIEVMYRLPFFFKQVRRSLVASGPAVPERIKAALEGTDSDLNTLFKDKKLDMYCGDVGQEQLPLSQCVPVSAMDYYAAIIAGDLYDPTLVPSLLKALAREPKPAYLVQKNPGPPAQNGVLDALRKIGSSAAAQPVLDLAMTTKDANLKPMALGVYSFVSKDGSEKTGTTTGLDALGAIVKNPGDFTTRLEAATSYARLARTADRLGILKEQVKQFTEGAQKARAAADGAPKAALAAAQAPYDAARAELKAAKDAVARAGGEKKLEEAIKKGNAPVEILTRLTAATNALDKVEPAYDEAKADFMEADSKAKNYLASQRVFETHIARVEIAMRCGDKVECYGATLDAKWEDVKPKLDPYISGLAQFKQDEKDEILAAQIERAMLELGKMGPAAASQTDKLLEAAKSTDRIIRQSVQLALPKIAGKDCKDCGAKLDEAIAAGEGKTTLGDLNYETTVLRSYWGEAPSAE
ncbi:MAG: HEAT repeat domain-containing protein [Myxococcales bacterium]|nr:HEAT repeat domain-containing protein [Myxococcales bacterium]